MSSETAVSKDNFVLVLKGNVQIWIDEQEKEQLKGLLSSSVSFFEIRGQLVMKDSVLYVASAQAIEEANYIRRGWSKWDCGHWRPRNEKKCGDCWI